MESYGNPLNQTSAFNENRFLCYFKNISTEEELKFSTYFLKYSRVKTKMAHYFLKYFDI